MRDGLIAHYPFDGDANDASGNGNHGTVQGNLKYVVGKIGQAIQLNGKDTYIDVGDKADAMSNSFTLSAWIKTDNYNQYAKVVNKGQTNSGTPENSGYSLRFVTPEIVKSEEAELWFNFYDDSNTGSYSSLPISKLPTEQFLLITGVLDRQRTHNLMKLYVNGKLVSSKQADFVSSDTNIPLAIGALCRGNYGKTTEIFNGLIDDVRIYNRALSDSEIQNLYNYPNNQGD